VWAESRSCALFVVLCQLEAMAAFVLGAYALSVSLSFKLICRWPALLSRLEYLANVTLQSITSACTGDSFADEKAVSGIAGRFPRLKSWGISLQAPGSKKGALLRGYYVMKFGPTYGPALWRLGCSWGPMAQDMRPRSALGLWLAQFGEWRWTYGKHNQGVVGRRRRNSADAVENRFGRERGRGRDSSGDDAEALDGAGI